MGELEEAVAALREEFLEKFRETTFDARAFYGQVKNAQFVKAPLRFRDRSGEIHFVGVRPSEYYTRHNEWLQTTTRLMKEFVDGLYGMRHNVAWVQSEAEKIWPLFDKECHEWIAIACELEPRAKRPVDAEGTTTEGTATTVEAEKIRARLEARLARVQRSALNHVRILLAQEKERAKDDSKGAPSKDANLKATGKLPAQQRDLSEYFYRAKLTDLQHEVISLRLEYGLNESQIAKRLGRHRSTIQETIAAAKKKIQQASSNSQGAKKGGPEALESDE